MDENTIFNAGKKTQSVQNPPNGDKVSGYVSPLDTKDTLPVQSWKDTTDKKPKEEAYSFTGASTPAVSTQEVQPVTPPSESANTQTTPSSPPAIGNFPLKKILIGIALFSILVIIAIKFLIPLLSTTDSNKKITLTYWGLWEQESVMDTIISDFERENPNITVTYVKQDIKQYRQRFMTRIQNGDGPDIFEFHNSWVPMIERDLLPLPTDAISKNDFQTWYYPVTQSDLTKSGAIYGIPAGIDTLSLFVNTDLLAADGIQVPTTWEDFVTDAKQLTVPDETGTHIKTAGAALGSYDNITHAPDIISMLFVQNGVNLTNIGETKQSAIDALNFYTSFSQGDGKVWDSTLDPSILAFSKGNLAMYFGYSWDIFTIQATNPNLKFKIYPVPHLPSREKTIASYWANGVSVKTNHQKQALAFIKFLAKKETQQKIYTEISKTRLFGEPYARVDLAELVKDNNLVYPFVQQGPQAVSSYFASDTYDDGLNNQLNAYLGNAIRSILANTSTDTAVDTLNQGTTQVLKQYGAE